MVSVKTVSDIPKDKIFACMKQRKAVQVPAPVTTGQVILTDVAGTGVAVDATKNVASL